MRAGGREASAACEKMKPENGVVVPRSPCHLSFDVFLKRLGLTRALFLP